MASAQSVEKLFANAKITQTLSGDASTAKDISWVDLADYDGFATTAFLAVLGGNGIEAYSIIANSQSDGGGTDATVVSHADPTTANAAGDMVVLECTAEQVKAVETSSTGRLRYVSVKLETHHASDQVVVTYIRHKPRFAKADLTADVIT